MPKKGSGTVLSSLNKMIDGCFIESDAWISIWFSRIWLTALFLIGLLNWSVFINWGNIPLGIVDWAVITVPRLLALENLVNQGMVSLHRLETVIISGFSDNILVIPDMILSPQILLLRFLPPGQFLLVNLLLLYTAGFIGLLIFKKRQQLGIATFSILFLIFNFNGHLNAHLAVGHITWMSYFLLPYFVIIILELLEKETGWRWVLKVAILMVVIFLQGGYHFFVWLLIFLILIGVFLPKHRKPVFLASFASVMACLFRILPASLISSDVKLNFLGGFTTLNDLFRGVVVLIEPKELFNLFSTLNPYAGWWEFDYYIGWAGVIFIGGSLFLAWKTKSYLQSSFHKLLYPCMVMGILSIGRLYKPIFMLQIPLLNSERVPSRFLILPLLFLFFAASVYAQRLIDRYKPTMLMKVGLTGLFFLVFNDLQQHFELWSPAQLEKLILPVDLSASNYHLNSQNDPAYLSLLIAGGVISLLTLVVLIYLGFKNKTRQAARS